MNRYCYRDYTGFCSQCPKCCKQIAFLSDSYFLVKFWNYNTNYMYMYSQIEDTSRWKKHRNWRPTSPCCRKCTANFGDKCQNQNLKQSACNLCNPVPWNLAAFCYVSFAACICRSPWQCSIWSRSSSSPDSCSSWAIQLREVNGWDGFGEHNLDCLHDALLTQF